MRAVSTGTERPLPCPLAPPVRGPRTWTSLCGRRSGRPGADPEDQVGQSTPSRIVSPGSAVPDGICSTTVPLGRHRRRPRRHRRRHRRPGSARSGRRSTSRPRGGSRARRRRPPPMTSGTSCSTPPRTYRRSVGGSGSAGCVGQQRHHRAEPGLGRASCRRRCCPPGTRRARRPVAQRLRRVRVVEGDHRAGHLRDDPDERGRLVLLGGTGLAGHRPVPADLAGRPGRGARGVVLAQRGEQGVRQPRFDDLLARGLGDPAPGCRPRR